jgi:hypothetical protein
VIVKSGSGSEGRKEGRSQGKQRVDKKEHVWNWILKDGSMVLPARITYFVNMY